MGSLKVTRSSEIPPLSWLLVMGREGELFCGNSVEIRTEGDDWFFFEGCWDAPFQELSFLDATSFFGTGAAYKNRELTFATSCHTLDALYVLISTDECFVSNSLPFLIAVASLDLDANADLYRRISSIINGLEVYDRLIYQHDDVAIHRMCCCNFTINGKAISESPKALPPRFSTFSEYKSFLENALDQINSNATHPERRTRYKLLTTCSSGYDSAACTALAAALGCREVISLKTGRYGRNDSGRPVAEALGMSCIERERPLRSSPEGRFLDAEFIASFGQSDCVFQVFEDVVKRRLLLVGHPGSVWDTAHVGPNDKLKRKDMVGMGLNEFRLRNDCLIVSVLFIGAVRHPDLCAIVHSAEMQAYHVGGNYDKPIPRRITEEAGVPREVFGRRKAAGGLIHSEWRLARTTLQAADRFARRRVGYVFWIAEYTHRAVIVSLNAGMALRSTSPGANRKIPGYLHPMRLGARAVGAICALLFNKYHPTFSNRRYRNLLTLWALSKTAERYRLALPPGKSAPAPTLVPPDGSVGSVGMDARERDCVQRRRCYRESVTPP